MGDFRGLGVVSGVCLRHIPPVRVRNALFRGVCACKLAFMVLGIAVVIGLGAAVVWFLVAVGAAMLGIPLESKAKREARAQLASYLQAQAVEAEAARNVAVRAAEQRLTDER